MTGPEIRDAPREFCAYLTAARPDWKPDEVRDALIACHDAGWPWKRIHEEATRVLFTEGSAPAELAHAAGKAPRPRAGPGLAAEERDELRANALAACEAAAGRIRAADRRGGGP